MDEIHFAEGGYARNDLALEPDDFVHLALGAPPLIGGGPTGTVTWDDSRGVEKVALSSSEGAQKLTIDAKDNRWDVLETELAPNPPFSPLDPEVVGLGADDPALAREVFYNTMQSAVVPGLERLHIDAGTSWRERRRLV